jgi:hypothetical protein
MALFTGFEEAMHDFPKQVKPSFPETKLFAYVPGGSDLCHWVPIIECMAPCLYGGVNLFWTRRRAMIEIVDQQGAARLAHAYPRVCAAAVEHVLGDTGS